MIVQFLKEFLNLNVKIFKESANLFITFKQSPKKALIHWEDSRKLGMSEVKFGKTRESYGWLLEALIDNPLMFEARKQTYRQH